jgi:hypothetical protein
MGSSTVSRFNARIFRWRRNTGGTAGASCADFVALSMGDREQWRVNEWRVNE